MTLTRWKRSATALTVAAGALVALAPAMPARADARDARITRVTAAGAVLASGAAAAGTVDVSVSARADLGLEFVRLEGQTGSDPVWYCLEFWPATGATSFTQHRVWQTQQWTDPRSECRPGTCSSCTENSPHNHGIPTVNGIHRMRVVAREQGKSVSSGEDSISPTFSLNLSNEPGPAAWVGDPFSNNKPKPSVTVRWSPSSSPDVSEYHFVREAPDGTEREFAVSAKNPDKNGCSRVTDIAYTCSDGPLTVSGTYRYAIVAYRPAASGARCSLSPAPCIASTLSAVKHVSVTVAAGGANSGPSADASASPGQSAPATQTQSPLALPSEQAGGDVIPEQKSTAPAGSRSRAPALGVAALALLIAAAFLALRRIHHGKAGQS